MSWIKENYEKAALGGAAVLLVGLGALTFMGGDKRPSSKARSYDHNDDPGTERLSTLVSALEVRASKAAVQPKVIDGREVDVFIGQALYQAEGQSQPVDLYESGPVHAGISNAWWREHGLDPTFANAPERDADKDGFTNREEFEALTNPVDPKSHPSLLTKLTGDSVEVFKMQMRWSVFDSESITIYYQDTKRSRFNERVQLGGDFFANENGSVNGRFSIAAEQTKATDVRGRQQDAYVITDKAPRYKGTAREQVTLLRRGPKAGGFNELQDLSVELRLHALGKSGETFVINEYEKFSLPFDPKAKSKPFQVTQISAVAGQRDVFNVTIEGPGKDGLSESRNLTVRKN